VQSNANASIQGTITNSGANTITSVEVSWTAGAQNGSATIGDLNIGSFESASFTHPNPVAVANDNLPVTVTITAVNGQSDPNTADNELSFEFVPLLFVPERRVVLEQATGTWCQWCPRGHVFSEYMDDTYENSIEIAVHNNDPMANSTYDSGIGAIIGGYPSGLVDRFYNDIDPSQFEDLYLQRMEMPALASVEVETTYDSNTRGLDMVINASFAINTTGNYRINAILVEDNVTGTGSGYNQANAYSGGGAGAMGGYESLPNPVPASQMVYHHVGRRLMGGWSGTANSIPSSIVAGEVYTQEYSFTIPATWDDAEVTVVGVIIDQATGEIVNANESQSILSADAIAEQGFDFQVYPNPANTNANILLSLEKAGDVTYTMVDLSGRVVKAERLGMQPAGTYLHTLNTSDLSSGIYLLNVRIGEGSVTQKVSVSK
jgi:hypothetical protein